MPQEDLPTETAINTWILQQLQKYYYWNSELPARPVLNQDPVRFFNALKNTADRFSTLYYKKDPSSIAGTLMNTFGIDIVGVVNQDRFQVVIIQTVPGSEAAAKGLTRGQLIKALNGQPVTSDNIALLVQEAIKQKSILITKDDNTTVAIAAGYIAEPVVYKQAIFAAEHTKTGYLFLNSFEFHGAYEILEAFELFRTSGVRDLVIDLRYNTGGSVPFTAFLAALVAPVKEDQLFVTFKGNNHAGTINSSFSNELQKQPDGYNFSWVQLAAHRLTISRVYILTGRHTISAAELFINNLKPYIKVIQIGETTFGKDMASLEIKDDRNPPVITDLILYPMVFKMYNARGAGNYAAGIPPDYMLPDPGALPLYPIGDSREPLLNKALSLIQGAPPTATQTLKQPPALSITYSSRAATGGIPLIISLPERSRKKTAEIIL
ncbi:S41 family peptidase [Niabella beijingensis]|uniref:S41 family peptidase n=1 Tax=Niabella beijingensis TaxID=2872700 RepID=UPI001CBCC25C|nr:S41 family peptidase [Niabella beijingensis]MBZ4188010.1 hypothetical protein [Niabella beijingensis]